MRLIDVKSLPICRFAHTYAAPIYRHSFDKRSDMIEITYVKEGKLTVKKGESCIIAQKGDIIFNSFSDDFIIFSDEYHCHHTVGFKVEFDIEGEIHFVLSGSNISSQIYYLIDEMIKLKSLSPESKNKLSGMFLQLIGELESEMSKTSVRSTAEHHYVRSAKQYIIDNITLPIRQAEIAEFLGITPEYLCSVFKKCTGETVIRFVNRVKLEGIRSLMDRERVPLYRAAEHYGYSDPNYVSRLYAKYFGACITDKR